MSFDILQDIREIFHGLGERRPRFDTVTEIQSVLLKQMVLLIYQARVAADTKFNFQIKLKHVLHVLQNHRLTLIRILRYYWLKDTVFKTATISQTTSTEDEQNIEPKTKKLFDNDFVDCILNSQITPPNSDSVSLLKSLNFKSKSLKNHKKRTMFTKICVAMEELQWDLKITEEDINNSILERQIRVDHLSVVISSSVYENFEVCRRSNFQNKIGSYLLSEVHKALPLDVDYGSEVKELFLFLAKETIACLYDRVCENRKLKEPNHVYNTHSKNLSKKNYIITLVDEIKAVTEAAWNPSLGDICVPYEEDNKFFANQLIFD